MANTVTFPSERTPLILSLPPSSTDISDPSTTSSRTVLDVPDQATGDQETGVGKLDLKLFTTLLWDSIPGAHAFYLLLNFLS